MHSFRQLSQLGRAARPLLHPLQVARVVVLCSATATVTAAAVVAVISTSLLLLLLVLGKYSVEVHQLESADANVPG